MTFLLTLTTAAVFREAEHQISSAPGVHPISRFPGMPERPDTSHKNRRVISAT
jgi:hypothetical protein